MVAKSFEVGDLVWAKMKGFPPWPGKIVSPPAEVKPPKIKKSHHFVFFYGSENHAWIPDENIVLHNNRLAEEYASKKRSSTYLSAIETIVDRSKSNSKYLKQLDSSFEKHSSDETSPKSKSPHSNNLTKKGEIKKKVPAKKNTVVKKVIKKRALSVDRNGAESSGFSLSPSKSQKIEEDYSNLLANIPPNIGYPQMSQASCDDDDDDTIQPSSGILSRNAYVERPQTPPLQFDVNVIEKKNIVPTHKKIGFLGLGKLGQGIVKNLLHSGHTVTIWNRTTEKCTPFVAAGAQQALTPADVVIASDITFCCVADADAAKALVFGNCGILKGLEGCGVDNKGYVEMTSMDPKTSQAIADEVTLKGGRYLEAPLSGSRLHANGAEMFVLGAGDKTLFDDCFSCFQAMARKTMYVSHDVGVASKLNIIHSMLLGTVYAALAESLALIERLGIDQGDFLEILNYGILDSEMLLQKGKAMAAHDYTSNTALKHMQKDINLGLMLGSSVEQPMPITAAANEVYKHCKLLRYSEHDVGAVYEGTRR